MQAEPLALLCTDALGHLLLYVSKLPSGTLGSSSAVSWAGRMGDAQLLVQLSMTRRSYPGPIHTREPTYTDVACPASFSPVDAAEIWAKAIPDTCCSCPSSLAQVGTILPYAGCPASTHEASQQPHDRHIRLAAKLLNSGKDVARQALEAGAQRPSCTMSEHLATARRRTCLAESSRLCGLRELAPPVPMTPWDQPKSPGAPHRAPTVLRDACSCSKGLSDNLMRRAVPCGAPPATQAWWLSHPVVLTKALAHPFRASAPYYHQPGL